MAFSWRICLCVCSLHTLKARSLRSIYEISLSVALQRWRVIGSTPHVIHVWTDSLQVVHESSCQTRTIKRTCVWGRSANTLTVPKGKCVWWWIKLLWFSACGNNSPFPHLTSPEWSSPSSAPLSNAARFAFICNMLLSEKQPKGSSFVFVYLTTAG